MTLFIVSDVVYVLTTFSFLFKRLLFPQITPD